MTPQLLLQHFDRIGEAPHAILRLRRFILDLAVRGKLVEQDPRDEPASELLKRIQLEKGLLVKEGKIKELKTREITDVGKEIYKIPFNWVWVPLAETVYSHLGGGTPSKNESTYWDGDIYWASVKDVGKEKYINETIDRITEVGLMNSSSNLIPTGNLIVVTRMGLGKVSINRVPIAINQDLRALLLSRFVSIDYHYIFFKTHGFKGTGLTVKGIKIEDLLNIAVPLPPLAEQHRIVAKVNELMDLCDRLEAVQTDRESRRDRLVASSLHHLNNGADTFQEHARFYFNHLPRLTTRPDHIKQLRQTILNLAVRGKLVPQDPTDEPASELLKRIQAEKENLIKARELRQQKSLSSLPDLEVPFSIPNSWIWLRLDTLAEKITDGEHLSPNKTTTGMPLLTATHVTSQGVTLNNPQFISIEDGHKSRQRCDPRQGDILICSRGTIGRCAVVKTDEIFCLMGSVILVRFPVETVPAYFNYFLSTDRAQMQMRGMSGATAVQALYLKDIRLCPVALPPLAEQHRIVAKVDELMALCDQLESQLTTTQSESQKLMEAILHETLTG